MSESWKAPAAVIGIITILFTIGTFVYNERKNSIEKEEQEKEASHIKDSIKAENISKKQKQESRISIEKRLEEIETKLTVFNDSLVIHAALISKSEKEFKYWVDQTFSWKNEFDSIRILKKADEASWKSAYGYRDSTEMDNRMRIILREKKQLQDSLKYYY